MGHFPFQGFEFIFKLPLLVHQPADRPRDFRAWSPQSVGNLLEKILVFFEAKISSESGQCFDSPDSGRDTRFGHDFEQTHIAGHPSVCTATQFHADFRNGNDANLLLIFFPEES